MKLPRWNCLNDEHRRHLEEWTLAQLDKLDKDLVTQRDIESMEAMDSNPDYHKWVYQQFLPSDQQLKRQQLRARVVKAAKAKDPNLKLLTGNDPELLQLAVRVLTFKRGVGRPKGSRKSDIVVKVRGKKRVISADIVGEARSDLERAAIDVYRIYDLWQDTFWEDKRGHRNRKESPTAVKIAARRWGFKVSKLRKFRKNFARPNYL